MQEAAIMAVDGGGCMDAAGLQDGGDCRGPTTPHHHHQKREATRSIQKIDMPQLIHPLILLTLLARLLVMYVMISPTTVSDHPTTSPATRMRPLGLAAECIPEPVRWSLFLPS